MNKNEAMSALRAGELLTHTSFTNKEWIKGERGKYVFEDGVKCTPEEFWSTRTNGAFDTGWSLNKITIEDRCVCGEAILIEFNAESSGRTDNKRPHYHDSALPEKPPIEHNSVNDLTVHICRKCFQRVSDTVPMACYETEF